MKNLLLLLLCLFGLSFTPIANAQPEDLGWDITIGKRKNSLFAPAIREINLGKTYASFNRLYFKIGEEGEWQRVGATGKKLFPYIPTTEFSQFHFKRYQTLKVRSYWCLGLSNACTVGWMASSIDFITRRRFSPFKSILQPRSLAWLAGTIGFNLLGIHWNSSGDMELYRAVKGDQVEQRRPVYSWQLGLNGSGELALVYRF